MQARIGDRVTWTRDFSRYVGVVSELRGDGCVEVDIISERPYAIVPQSQLKGIDAAPCNTIPLREGMKVSVNGTQFGGTILAKVYGSVDTYYVVESEEHDMFLCTADNLSFRTARS